MHVGRTVQAPVQVTVLNRSGQKGKVICYTAVWFLNGTLWERAQNFCRFAYMLTAIQIQGQRQNYPLKKLKLRAVFFTCLRRVVDRLHRAATQRDLDRVEKWADRNLINSSKGNKKALHLGSNSLMTRTGCGKTWWRAALQKRTCMLWWTTCWIRVCVCCCRQPQDNLIVGCISKCSWGTAGRGSDSSPLFGTCETSKVVRGLEHVIFKEKQRVDLFSLKRRWREGRSYCCAWEATEPGSPWGVHDNGMTGNGHKLV